MCRSGGLVEPQDLEQQAWTALLEAAQSYQREKSNAKFTTYAWVWIDFKVREIVLPRSKRRHKTISESELGDDSFEDLVIDGFDDFKSFEDGDAFHRAIGMLTAEELELVNQHFVEGLSFTDIAALDGVSKQMIQRRVSNAIQKLQRRLAREDSNSD